MFRTIPARKSDPCVFFHGTPEEKAAAEQEEKEIETAWKDILYGMSFDAFQFTNNIGNVVILSPSIRPGIDWQLSYFDDRGAIMHGNYCWRKENLKNGHSMKELLRELQTQTTHGATVEII